MNKAISFREPQFRILILKALDQVKSLCKELLTLLKPSQSADILAPPSNLRTPITLAVEPISEVFVDLFGIQSMFFSEYRPRSFTDAAVVCFALISVHKYSENRRDEVRWGGWGRQAAIVDFEVELVCGRGTLRIL
jgi:hypothetical protein